MATAAAEAEAASQARRTPVLWSGWWSAVCGPPRVLPQWLCASARPRSCPVLWRYDTGGNGSAIEQIAGQLDHAVNEVVVNQVLADLLLGAGTVHDTGEADDGSSAVGGQPCQRVHDKGQICFGFGSQHTGRREAGIVDEHRAVIALPLDGIRGIGYDDLKGLLAPVLRVHQSVLVGNAELVIVNVVEE